MVIDAPRTRTQRSSSVPAVGSPLTTSSRSRRAADSSNRTYKQFRIRRTQDADLDAVSTMLALESVPPSTGDSVNWNDGMKRLRAKSLLEKQLTHRLAAIEEGRKSVTVHRRKQQQLLNDNNYDDDDDTICSLSDDDDDECYHLWINDAFRSKLKNAICNSQETNAWTRHNFDLTPSSWDMLNHAMMSVEDKYTGEIVGFAEVAWLPSPTGLAQLLPQSSSSSETTTNNYFVSDDSILNVPQSQSSYCNESDDSYCDAITQSYYEEARTAHHVEQQQQFAPAIVNLVTSSNHRRMGIASRVINFASKYTNTQWLLSSSNNSSSSSSSSNNCNTRLGLYVRPENESALRLYSKKGFEVVSGSSSDDNVDDGLLYMSQMYV